MGALYQLTIDDDVKPLIYALDLDDAWEIDNRWFSNPENAKIKLHEEQ
jgi:hypothetical protein